LALLAILGLSGILCMGGDTAPAPAPTALGHPFLCADYGAGKVCKVDKDGKIEWQYKAPGTQDVWLLPGGNILLTHVKGVQEVSPEGKVVWEYKTDKDNEIHACQPLPDGVVMVAESGPCRIIEVDREGKILKEVKLTTDCKGTHGQMRGARKLAGGNYIVGQYTDAVVREYDPAGKVVWEFKQSDAFIGIRLPNGNTLVAAGDAHKVVEVDPKGQVVWELKENDLPGCPLRFVAGVQRLANGNTVICNWGGHGHVGKQPQIVEVSPDKKIVSQLFDNKQFQTISGVFILDEKGDSTKFGLCR
jgi:outer membrane protein assembly factor BamB